MTNTSKLMATMLLAALFTGCGEDPVVPEKSETPAPKGGIVEVRERMRDPEYVKSLKENMNERTDIIRKLSAAKAKLDAAKAAGEAAEKIAELQAEVVRLSAQVEANRGKAQSLIRDKMLSNETAAKQENLKK